jgi:hypothetical protein
LDRRRRGRPPSRFTIRLVGRIPNRARIAGPPFRIRRGGRHAINGTERVPD